MSRMQVTSETLVSQILENLPGAIGVFDEFGMDCYECSGCEEETLREATQMHGVDVNQFIARLNELEESH